MSWGIAVVAGGLCPDELAVRIGTPRKALAKFGDRTALEIVLAAAERSEVGPIVTVSGPDIAPFVKVGGLLEETTSAVDNAIAASAALNTPKLLIIPADMPFLTASSLREFTLRLDARVRSERWYAAGLCPLREYRHQYPDWECSPIHLRSGRILSGGLFATTPEGLTAGRDLFNSIRRSRKNQLAMVKKFGFGAMVRYLLRQITVEEAEARLGCVLGGEVVLDLQADPVTILDYDTAAEYEMALRLYQASPNG